MQAQAVSTIAATEAEQLNERMAVSKKILSVMEEVGYIQKKGKNDFHNYTYVQEADVMEAVGKACMKHGLVILPSTITSHTDRIEPLGQDKYGKPNKPFLLTTVEVLYQFIDTDTGATLSVKMEGQGSDNQDKGMYKAITGATKYALMKTLLLSSGDDPEKPESTNGNGITPHAESVAPNTLIPGVILDFSHKEGGTPHKIRVALQDGDITFTQHRLPCTEELIRACLGKQVNLSYRKQGRFYEMTELVPVAVTAPLPPPHEDTVASDEYDDHMNADAQGEDDTDDSGWISGEIKAYGKKNGIKKDGSEWTLHTLDLMTADGSKIRATTFSLSMLSPETEWNPDNIEHAVEQQMPVQFQLEAAEKNGKTFHNIVALELG